jgi:hypothetical protein
MKTKNTVTTLQPRHLITGLLAFIVLAVVVFALVWPALVRAAKPTTAEIAAREGAAAFMSIDYKAGRPAWERELCRVSTDKTCELFAKDLGTMLWGGAERAETRQKCLATEATREAADGDRQIWNVSLDCRDLDTDETTTGDLLVAIAQVEGGWLFERPLFAEEAQNVD